MTDKQPEALRLADVAQRFGLGEDVAVELRRLHEENKILRQTIEQAEKQEPVAWGIANTRPTEKHPLMMVMTYKPEPSSLVVPLYTAPPQREWQGLTDDIGDQFAHRLAVMLECALLSPEKTWEEAHALLDEYREALYKRDRELGLPYVSGFGKD